jgi:hypothetical protein
MDEEYMYIYISVCVCVYVCMCVCVCRTYAKSELIQDNEIITVTWYGPNIKNKYACAIWKQCLKCELEAAALCIS